MNDKVWRSYSYPELLFVMSNLLENCSEKHFRNPPDKIKHASGKSGTGENSKALSLAKEIEMLRRAYAEKEKRELLFQQSRSQRDVCVPRNEREAELLGVPYIREIEPETLDTPFSEFEVLECEDGTSPHDELLVDDMDAQALGYRKERDSESDGNSDVEAEVQESDCVEIAASKYQLPTTINENAVKQIVLSPEKAEEVLLLLDTMNIRLVQSESKFFGKLKKDIAGAQQNIDRAKKLLSDIPPFTSQASSTEFIMEVGQYVESIFCCLEDLSRKLMECHAREMCYVVDDLKEGLKSIGSLDELPVSKTSVKKVVPMKNVFMLEITFAAIAAVLFCLALFLLKDPVVIGVISEFYANATKF